MKRAAILVFLNFCCAFLFSQTSIAFSRVFQTHKKSVPVALVNNHETYFHVLRYNKLVHDFTIERRSKPSAEILAFTPLRLDSVNADWFNYEKLDYQIFEVDYKLYFVFKKEENTKQSVYLKTIDTAGKSSGFKLIASVERDANSSGISLVFSKTTNNNILVVSGINAANGVTKKTAILYDVKKSAVIWTKKLPHENSVTEITEGFTANEQNDLFYVHLKVKSYSFLKKETELIKIINEFGDISVFKSTSDSKEIQQHITSLPKTQAIYNNTLVPVGNDVLFYSYYVEGADKNERKSKIHIERLSGNFGNAIYSKDYLLPESVNTQLTFYDGSDFKIPAYKNYRSKLAVTDGKVLSVLTERKDENFYKELMLSKINNETGDLVSVNLVPRKIFYFDDRTRFRQMGNCMLTYKNNCINALMLEAPSNAQTNPDNFKYGDFSKQTGLSGNVVTYRFNGSSFKKELIHKNKDEDLIPLNYISENARDEVFYFNMGKTEKFGIISLNPF